MKLNSYRMQERVWVAPAIYSTAAVALALAVFYADIYLIEQYGESIPAILLTELDLARTIMGMLAAALLTMTTFTFSTVLVVLTTYSAQFSPRTPENFVHGKITRRVLGVFLGGFVYTSLSLLLLQENQLSREVLAASVGILVAFLCVGMFAYYVHYVASNVQVSALVNKLMDDTEKIMDQHELLQDRDSGGSADQWNPSADRVTVTAERAGYIQKISLIKLADYAGTCDVEIEAAVQIGDYIYNGQPLFHIHCSRKKELDLQQFYAIGNERTVEQDLGYAVQKLIEVALRAISSGLNDPNTAVEIIVRLGRLLGRIAYLDTDGWIFLDREGRKRVLYHFPSYSKMLYKTFYQLVHHGSQDVSVLTAMIEALEIAASIAPEHRYEALWEMQLYILEGIQWEKMKSLDRKYLQDKVDRLAVRMGRSTVDLTEYTKEPA